MSRSRWLFAAALLVACLVGGSLLPASSQKEGPAYSASALLLVHEKRAIDGREVLPSGKPPERHQVAVDRKTQLVLVKSRLVLNTALQGLAKLETIKKHEDPLAWLEKELEVKFLEDSAVLRVRLAGDKPEDLIAIVNAVVEAYVREIVNEELNARVKHLDRLTDYYQKYQNQVVDKRHTLKKLTEELGIGSASFREQLRKELAVDCGRELWRIKLSQSAVRARLARSQTLSKDEREKLQDELAVQETQEKLLAEELERLSTQLSRRQVDSLDMEFLRKEIEQTEALLRKIGEQKEMLQIELPMPARVIRLQEATATKEK